MVGDEWAQRLGESAGRKVDALSPISQVRECELGVTGAIACGICSVRRLHLAIIKHIGQALTSSPWDRLYMRPRGSLPAVEKHMGRPRTFLGYTRRRKRQLRYLDVPTNFNYTLLYPSACTAFRTSYTRRWASWTSSIPSSTTILTALAVNQTLFSEHGVVGYNIVFDDHVLSLLVLPSADTGPVKSITAQWHDFLSTYPSVPRTLRHEEQLL
jgi:hypothetical protein